MSSDASQNNYSEEIKKMVEDIIHITEQLDERYREKAFEILLKHSLEQKSNDFTPKAVTLPPDKASSDNVVESTPHCEPILPINVRAFLQQNSVPEEAIFKLFIIEPEGIAPKFKIVTTRKSEAQIQVALLAALQHSISKQGNKFEFSIEEVRQSCQARGLYDMNNFKANFTNNAKLFKSLADQEHVELSPEGQTELADVIQSVAK